jgi:hypothetical protein
MRLRSLFFVCVALLAMLLYRQWSPKPTWSEYPTNEQACVALSSHWLSAMSAADQDHCQMSSKGCIALAGQWGWTGAPRHEGPPNENEGYCILPAKDAGNLCISQNDCQGMCAATPYSSVTRLGRCSSSNYSGGCLSRVENGAVSGQVCSD